MRTTLDIEEDELEVAKEIARRKKISTGKTVSDLLREALSGKSSEFETGAMIVGGFRPFKTKNPKIVANELIDQLRDSDGT